MKPMNLLDAYKKDTKAQGVTATLADGTTLRLRYGFDLIDDQFTSVWRLGIQEQGQSEQVIYDTDLEKVWAEVEKRGVTKTDVIWYPVNRSNPFQIGRIRTQV